MLGGAIVESVLNFKIHSSYEMKDLVETHLGNIVCDIPIERMWGRKGRWRQGRGMNESYLMDFYKDNDVVSIA